MLISRMFLCTVTNKEQEEEQQHHQQSNLAAGDTDSNKKHLAAVRRYCLIYSL
jgi:hypothetical protein